MTTEARKTKALRLACAAALILCAPITALRPAQAQDPYIGELRLFGFNFCPRFWTAADGRLLKIQDYQALYSLFGTIYGGDGRTTFALPDLRGRAPIGAGQGPGLQNRPLGGQAGAERFTLDAGQMPAHGHPASTTATLRASSKGGRSSAPAGKVLANDGRDRIYRDAEPDVAMSGEAITATTTVARSGGGQAVAHRGPALAMTWCVALQGLYPPRN